MEMEINGLCKVDLTSMDGLNLIRYRQCNYSLFSDIRCGSSARLDS